MAENKRRLSSLDLLEPPEQWSDIERRRPRDVLEAEPSPTRRIVVGVVALCAAAAAIGWALFVFLGPRTEVPVTPIPPRVTGQGISVVTPPGWQARIDYLRGTTGPSVQEANFPFPAAGTSLFDAVRQSGGIAVQLRELIGACGCQGVTSSTLPLSIQQDDISSSSTESDVARTVRVQGRYFSLSVAFGTGHVSQAQLAEANNVLRGIVVQPGVTPRPVGTAGRLPAQFAPEPGWWQASMPSVRQDSGVTVPITWASTARFKASDFRFLARDETLQGWPPATLRSMPSDGIVIVVWIQQHVFRPNANFPRMQLPLKLSDATIERRWEGGPANVPLYLLQGTVDRTAFTVSVYFGSQHPSATSLTDAQQMLNGLRIPPA